MHGVFTLLLYIAICKKTHLYEKIGTAIVAIGAVIMILDPKAKRIGEEVNPGKSVLTLVTNLPGAGFWIGNDKLLEMMD